jgi:hypothetical protein
MTGGRTFLSGFELETMVGGFQFSRQARDRRVDNSAKTGLVFAPATRSTHFITLLSASI